MLFNPIQATPQEVIAFILIFMRISGIFLVAPVFASANVPSMVKASWTLIVSLLLFPVIPFQQLILPTTGIPLFLDILKELFVGFVLGMAVSIVFSAFELAGQLIDIQMGFGLVNVIDPVTGSQVSIMGNYYYFVATVVFLAIDGHYILLRAIAASFTVIPLGTVHFTSMLEGQMNHLFSQMFLIGFQIALPVIAALFLTNLISGIVARTIPQMNVFIVTMPLNIAVGLLIAAVSMSFTVYLTGQVFNNTYHELADLIQSMR